MTIGHTLALVSLMTLAASPAVVQSTPPAPGDVIVNEYAADNDAKDNDFFELLVVADLSACHCCRPGDR